MVSLFHRFSNFAQIAPLTLVLVVFLVAPMAIILVFSFLKFNGFQIVPGFTFENYTRMLGQAFTYQNYWATIRITAITWAITLVLGFSLSYFFVFDLIQFRVKILFFLLAVVPFWTSGVVRMISWLPFLGREGLINRSIIGLGLTDQPLDFLLFSEFAVILSYVHVFTLFMVAPLFNVMARIDRDLLEAARDQGASGWQVLWNIIVPMSRPGIAIGTIFVVALTASDFTAVRVLSGGKAGTVALTIANQYAIVQHPFATANGIVLLIVLLAFVGGLMRLVDVREQL